jgi:hypothetical protein
VYDASTRQLWSLSEWRMHDCVTAGSKPRSCARTLYSVLGGTLP